MKRIPYAVSLTAQHQMSNKPSIEEQNFLIADDCATTAANLFWLISYIAEDAATVASERIAFETEDTTVDAEDARLLKAVSTVAQIGYAVSENLLSVISQIEDANRRSKVPVTK